MILTSTLTCPVCAAKTTETMEVNACRYLDVCPACGATLRPRPGDCCVFCSTVMCRVRRSKQGMPVAPKCPSGHGPVSSPAVSVCFSTGSRDRVLR